MKISIFKVSIEKQTYRSKKCLIQRKNYGKTLDESLNRLDNYLFDYQYHFCTVWVHNKTRNSFEKRLLVIQKVKTKKGSEIKFSFTNADLVQYTEKGIAYMQAQRFFVEHSIKESKKILGMSQFQTRNLRVAGYGLRVADPAAHEAVVLRSSFVGMAFPHAHSYPGYVTLDIDY